MEERAIRLQNEKVVLEVSELGAEMMSAVWRETGRQMIWQADPALWQGHAPLLFPYCGRLFGNVLRARGNEYPAPIHGFVRQMRFECERAGEDAAAFMLKSNAETRKMYPYEFELRVEYCLQGAVLCQTVTARNPGQPDGGVLPFSVGFHPGFALADALEWEIVFEEPESPRVAHTPGGYVSGEESALFVGQKVLPLADDIFAGDSLCLQGLNSSTITLRPRGSTSPRQGVRIGIAGFANVLLWGPPQGPLPFVCIEPWHGLPDGLQEVEDFERKPHLVHLTGGENWQTTLKLEFLG